MISLDIVILVGLLGLILGSFCNVVISRLPKMIEQEWEYEHAVFAHEKDPEQWPLQPEPNLSLSSPRSHCPHCKTTLRWYELIPVLSWAWQRGACRHCGKPIAWLYPLVELTSALLAVAAVLYFGLSAYALAAYVFMMFLLAGTIIDAQTQWLPDRITLPLLWLGLLFASLNLNPLGISLSAAVWGTMLGWGLLWTLATGFKVIAGKHGMGGGDIKLLAALGAWLGPLALPSVLLAASLLGLSQALWLRWRHQQQGAFAFGPALAIAGAMIFLWGLQ